MRSLIAALMLPFVGWSVEASAEVCPAPVPSLADLAASVQPAKPQTLKPYSISQTVAHYYDAALGLGILDVGGNGKDHYYDWMFYLDLPLWKGPGSARPLGWLTGGRLYTDTGVSALTGAGMVETGYESTSFIVWEVKKEWFKIKLAKGVSAWTHRCHLRAAKINIDFVPWPTFLGRHGKWLHFRTPVPHMLRTSPRIESNRVTTIGLDHKLVLRGIQGDWMEVEVSQPDITCGGGGGGVQPIRHRGWIKWRDAAGPWVYFYTRGC